MPITNLDRSGAFGASDASTMMRNWGTKTFKEWWMVKTGIFPNPKLDNAGIRAGNFLEVPVLEALDIPGMKFGKEPFVYPHNEYLRVNLDGYTNDTIYEVKCVGKTSFEKYRKKPSKEHWRQCQVQMIASGMRFCKLVIYPLTDRDYTEDAFINPQIDASRILIHDIAFDEEFKAEFLDVLSYLSECLRHKILPDAGRRRRK